MTRNLKPEALEILQDAVAYLHSFRDACQSRDELEDLGISLRCLGECRRDNPDPWLAAVYMVTGLHPAKYITARQARSALLESEARAAIPDYDALADPQRKPVHSVDRATPATGDDRIRPERKSAT